MQLIHLFLASYILFILNSTDPTLNVFEFWSHPECLQLFWKLMSFTEFDSAFSPVIQVITENSKWKQI